MSSGRLRRIRFEANGFEAMIAIACTVSALRFFLDPDALSRSPVGQVLHPWDYLWSVGFLLGGLGILAGLWFGRGDFEVFGLLFLAGAVTVQASAVLRMGEDKITGVIVYAAVALACAARARLIWHFAAVTEDY